MIIDPVTLPLTSRWRLKCYERTWNWRNSIVDENRILKELLLIEIYVSKKKYKTNIEVMTSENLVTVAEELH
jgi:hypothetical protein